MSKSALIIGCGSIGSRHAKNLDSLGIDLSVFDIDTNEQRELAEELDANMPTSVKDGLAENPDMAFICTPSNHHVQPAKKAAEAGCALFVEKPLSNNMEGVEELVQTAEEHELISMIGCNYRFHPAIKEIKRLLHEDAVGEIISARIETGSYLPDWHPWEDYREMYSAKEGIGGVLLDAIHGINYGRWFFEDESLVSGFLGYESSLEIETEDTASLLVKYENGIQCEYHFDYVQRIPIRSGQITGESGMIRWGGKDKQVVRFDIEKDQWIVERGYEDYETNEMYLEMTKHFLKCVENRKQTTSPLHEGQKDLDIAIKAKESYESGKHIETNS